jgi:hypothetical protein
MRPGIFPANGPVGAGRYQNEWTGYRDQRRKTWLMIPLHSPNKSAGYFPYLSFNQIAGDGSDLIEPDY